MSKPHSHPQTMDKTSAQYKKDKSKIVGGVALIKYQIIAS